MTYVTDSDFDSVINSNNIVLIKMTADWCAPCKQLNPVLEQIENKFDNLKVLNMDVDTNSIQPTKYAVRNLPTILYFKQGKEVLRTVGSMTLNDLSKKIETII